MPQMCLNSTTVTQLVTHTETPLLLIHYYMYLKILPGLWSTSIGRELRLWKLNNLYKVSQLINGGLLGKVHISTH